MDANKQVRKFIKSTDNVKT